MLVNKLIVAALLFARTLVGIVRAPYATYRRLAERQKLWELLYIGILLAAYFAVASLVKTAAFRPFLLTKQFVKLAGAAGAGYLLTVALLWRAGLSVGGKGKAGAIALAWGYTLIPTLVWFLTTSILYVVVPPPRTTSPQGIIFSILYLVFSSTLFFWKATLAYLTLRFGLKLDLGRILVVGVIVLPCLAVYSIIMYRMGIYKVPFL